MAEWRTARNPIRFFDQHRGLRFGETTQENGAIFERLAGGRRRMIVKEWSHAV